MKDLSSCNRHMYKRQETGSGQTLPFASITQDSVVAKRRKNIYKFSILMLSICLLLSVSAVIITPLLVGGTGVTADLKTAQNIAEEKVACKSLSEASDLLGFSAVMPVYAPEGAAIKEYNVVDGKIFEIVYTQDNGTEFIFRMAQGSEDPSGDDKDYAYNASEDINGIVCMYSGDSETTLNLAVWINYDYIFSLSIPGGMPQSDMYKYIEILSTSLASEQDSGTSTQE